MLCINPKNRITCTEILKHEYFNDIKNLVPFNIYRRYEQDILKKKPLFFKGFMVSKSNKIASDNIK
jgi:serine/threonine protein kinase